MKLHLNSQDGNQITACHGNTVYINKEPHTESLLVLPERLITGWAVNGVAEINAEVLEQAAIEASQGMVVLLGCGEKSPPINPEWQAPFSTRKAVLEIMSLPAACRTYNFLNADGRLVMAALVLNKTASA